MSRPWYKRVHKKKRIAKKWMACGTKGHYWWDHFEEHGLPKPGDIMHDCDGGNHVITRVELSWTTFERGPRKYFTVAAAYKRFSDGAECFGCGCLGHQYEPPAPRDEIIRWTREWCTDDNPYKQSIDEGAFGPESKDRFYAWRQHGESMFDENGVRVK